MKKEEVIGVKIDSFFSNINPQNCKSAKEKSRRN
jgi:hypothetical protein